MKSWDKLSEGFISPQGLVVQPIDNDIALEELSEALRNGLMVPIARDHWATLCQDGARQILKVTDGDRIVANAELKVHQGSVRTMFVRGYDNVEFSSGSSEYDAVASYITAVNSRDIPLMMEPSGVAFVAAGRDHEVTSKWAEALQAARAQQTSPFAALVGVHDQPADDLDGEVQVQTWTPLSGPFTKNGLIVEPVSSVAGLQIIGAELENSLMIMDGVKSTVASSCRDGRLQVAAIYDEDDSLVAYAELKVINGQFLAASCRGYADEPPTLAVAQAVLAYVNAVNANTIVTNLDIGADRFGTDGHVEALNPFSADSHNVYVGSSVPRAMRTTPAENYGYGYGYGDDPDDDIGTVDDDDLDSRVRHEGAVEWTGLTEPFTSEIGLIVEPVTTKDDLQVMGETMRNALATMASMWADRCAEGKIQIVRIVAQQEDGTKTTVANAELGVSDGLVVPSFNRGYENGPVSYEAERALREYCTAVNEGVIDLKIEVNDDEFGLDAPTPSLGM